MEKLANENNNQEKAEVAISGSMLMSEKDSTTKNITRDKERYFIMLKRSVNQEHIIALLCIKKKLIKLKILFGFYCISSL